MRTFRTIIVTFVVTMVLGFGAVTGFLVNEGIVTIERRVQEHTKTVVVDGEITQTTNWYDVKGYRFVINEEYNIDL